MEPDEQPIKSVMLIIKVRNVRILIVVRSSDLIPINKAIMTFISNFLKELRHEIGCNSYNLQTIYLDDTVL